MTSVNKIQIDIRQQIGAFSFFFQLKKLIYQCTFCKICRKKKQIKKSGTKETVEPKKLCHNEVKQSSRTTYNIFPDFQVIFEVNFIYSLI